jgi:hypothetical protein
MPLDFQTVDIKFTKGQDTRTQKKLVVPGKWLQLINYSLSDDNTPVRRDGCAPLVSTASGNGLATYSKQLLTLAGGAVSSVTTAGGFSSVKQMPGRLGYVQIGKTEVRRPDGVQDQPDCAAGGGYICYVWRQNSIVGTSLSIQGVRCTLIDAATGTHLIDDGVVDSTTGVGDRAVSPRVVYANGAFFIFFIVGTGAGTSLKCSIIETSAPTTLNAPVALIASANLSRVNFDVCAFNTAPNGTVLVAYKWADGVTSLRAVPVDQAGGVPSLTAAPTNVLTEAAVPNANIHAIGVALYSGGLNVGIFVEQNTGTPGITAAVVDPAVAVSAGPIVIYSYAVVAGAAHICATTSGANMQVFADQQGAFSTNALSPISTVLVDSALNVITPGFPFAQSASYGGAGNPRGPQGPWIFGKPFESNNSTFLPVCVMEDWSGTGTGITSTALQNTVFVIEGSTSTAAVVGKALYGSFGIPQVAGSTPAVGTPCSVARLDTGEFVMTAMERTIVSQFDGNDVSQTGVVSLTMVPNFTSSVSRAQLGETTFIAGGSLTGYDGALVTEIGFPLFPEGLIAAAVAGAGCTDGVHLVTATYDWIDTAGQLHVSAPAPAVSVTTGGGNSVIRVRIPTLQLSQKTGLTISLWATAAAGLTFNLASQFNVNDTTVPFVTLNISDTDATLAGNELLYTQPNQAGTQLPNIAPGPCSFVWVAQNRLWFDKSDKPLWFGFSQEYVNNVGLRFNPVLEDVLPVESGGFVAGAQLDEKVIIFGRDRIYAKYGTGPTPSGGYNNYSKPTDIQSDVGCSDPASVLTGAPNGIIFKSALGWHMLKRDLSVDYIGEAVADLDAQSVTSAVLMGDRKEARFTLSGGGSIVFSTLIGEWSRFIYNDSTLNTGGQVLSDAVWWSTLGRYVWICTTGLNNDISGTLSDTVGTGGAVVISTRAKTGWLKIGAMEGFQRVRRAYITADADSLANLSSILTVTIDVDDKFISGGVDLFQVNTATLAAALASGDAVDFRHKLKVQKCKSVAFTFDDAPSSSSKSGLSGLQAMALELGLKKGVYRLPAGQSF